MHVRMPQILLRLDDIPYPLLEHFQLREPAFRLNQTREKRIVSDGDTPPITSSSAHKPSIQADTS